MVVRRCHPTDPVQATTPVPDKGQVSTLADGPPQVDFTVLTSASDLVMILSSEPLTTDEQWQSFQPRESLAFRTGAIQRRNRSGVRPPALMPRRAGIGINAERRRPPHPAQAQPPRRAVARG
ncbi:MAG: class II glutamine amidotransferase [Synechococcaceae cyanobacterium]